MNRLLIHKDAWIRASKVVRSLSVVRRTAVTTTLGEDTSSSGASLLSQSPSGITTGESVGSTGSTALLASGESSGLCPVWIDESRVGREAWWAWLVVVVTSKQFEAAE